MVGKTISHYKILAKLGEGGMGVVYKAEDTRLKRIVALKFLSPYALKNKAEKTRFIHEAQAAAALDHPNICTIHEIDEADGQLFIVMAYIEGQSLKEKIETGPLKLEETLNIAMQVAEGLQAAHEKKITHRDIKPANVMITPKGQVKIMDFGLAKLMGREALTKEGTTLGTVAYMSPEQARGEAVDHRTDIWSFGVLLYEMITAQLPFRGEYDAAVMYSIINEEPEPMSKQCAEVPMALEHIVQKALAKRRDERYAHVDKMLAGLWEVKKEFGNDKTSPSDFAKRIKRRKRRKLAGITLLSTISFIAALVILFGILRSNKVDKMETPKGTKNEKKISIAVMYFDNSTGDPGLSWLSRGIPDMLITDLGQSQYLQLISLEKLFEISSAMGKEISGTTDRGLAVQIARRAKAKVIVTGSFIKAGEASRILAQLYDLDAGRLITTEKVEGKDLALVMDLVDQLSAKLKLALEIEASGTPDVAEGITKTKTSSVEAYKYYVIGIENLHKSYCRRSHYFPILCSDYFHRFSPERKGHAPTAEVAIT